MSKEPPPPPPSVADSGLLGSIDQKLRSQGVEPAKFETAAPLGQETKPSAPAAPQPVKQVSLEPKMAVGKGPLFLTPSESQSQVQATTTPEPVKQEKLDSSNDNTTDAEIREIPRVLVKGPVQPTTVATAAKAPEPKKPISPDDEDDKGVVDYLKQDVESIGKVLNPFRW